MHVICIKSQIVTIRKKDNKVRYRETPSDLELQNFCSNQETYLYKFRWLLHEYLLINIRPQSKLVNTIDNIENYATRRIKKGVEH